MGSRGFGNERTVVIFQLGYPLLPITQSILGTQPPHLLLAELMRRDIPIDWIQQRRTLGFL